jgi:hypothetical protein
LVSPNTVGLAEGAAVGLFVSPSLVGTAEGAFVTNLVGSPVPVGAAVGDAVALEGLEVGPKVGDCDKVGVFVSPAFVGLTDGTGDGEAVGLHDARVETGFSEFHRDHEFVS